MRAAVLVLGFASLVSAQERVLPTPVDYESMQRWEFSSRPFTVPEGGIRFERDGVTWVLESGHISWMRPIAGERVTGFVFEGEGRFAMTVPDPVEFSQVRRFAEEPEMERVETTFRELVLRSSEAPPITVQAGDATGMFRTHALARKRHEFWLVRRGVDVDARIVAALREPNNAYFFVDMNTEEWDWLSYEYDGTRAEEIRLIRQHTRFPEIWVSLDRARDRRPDGRPSWERDAVADLVHVEVTADLREGAGNARVGRSRIRPRNGKFVVDTTVSATTDGVYALAFELDSRAEVDSVLDEAGGELAFLRDHIGDRSLTLDDEIFDDEIVVLFDGPLGNGEATTIRFEYELKVYGFVRGAIWYPTLRENHLDRHTARLELTTDKKTRAHAMGTLVVEEEGEKTHSTVWSVDEPTTMITFVASRPYDAKWVELDGVPEVVAVGPAFGLLGGGRVEKLCDDVAEAVDYFQTLFDVKLPGERLFVTSIVAGHGQSFDGFLHLPESTLSGERPGKTELLRAHEVAHQWWGHAVRWRTYRDLWLSEAFAEYSAMMFIEAKVDDGEKHFEDILQAYRQMLNGSLRAAMSKFGRPQLIEMSARHRGRLGPIGVGHRAGTKEIPAGYFLQVYHKGPLVLHMLRELLHARTGSDERFQAVLSDFLRKHEGGLAGTEDFIAVVEANAEGDWKPFFDQWIFSNEIPTYHYRYDAARAPENDDYGMELFVEQSGTRETFPMAIPVAVRLEDGARERFSVIVENESEKISRRFASPVKELKLDPDGVLLARIEKQ